MSNIYMIKLPNGVYFAGWYQDMEITFMKMVNSFAFSLYGVRSKKNTIVIANEMSYRPKIEELVKFLKEKNLTNFDRIIILSEIQQTGSHRLRKIFQEFSKKVIFINPDRWTEENLTSAEIHNFADCLTTIKETPFFPLGHIKIRKALKEEENRLQSLMEKQKRIEQKIEGLEKPIKETEVKIKTIQNMKWIDSIRKTGKNLILKTKQMACLYVPNIARCCDVSIFEKNDLYYRIMKYQLLGKYFIIFPDYYRISDELNISGEYLDNRPKLTASEKVVSNRTYFQGMACHIGNGRACVGEMGSGVVAGQKEGIDFLLMSFEAYLRSINLQDSAGLRCYCLPMGDANGNIEVWPFVETIAKKGGVSLKGIERTKEGYEKFLTENSYFRNSGYSFSFNHTYFGSERDINLENALNLIKSREPEVYKKIMERVEKGVVL